MKRKILSMAKDFGCEITNYKSYKSDMGSQCFEFTVNYGGQHNFDYGYYYGGGKNKVIETFSAFLVDLDINPNSYRAQ